MYKNQLQELAQRSCFNLPSYTCFREGPDHAPRFKASVNFNGEVFDCPHYCSTIRQAEHSAAELALSSISHRGPSHSLAARILDETGVYKNLLQETSQRMGAPLPQYTTSMSATPGHQPTFTGKVELAGFTFTGVPSKTKKQAEKNAAMAAWSSLKQLTKEEGSSSAEPVNNDELEHITVARALLKYCTMVSNCSKKYTPQSPRPTRRPQSTSSRILPLIYPQETRQRPAVTASTERYQHSRFAPPNMLDLWAGQPQNLMHASGANPYAPMQPFGQACRSNVQPVTIRHAVPCYATPPSRPQPSIGVPRVVQPVTIRHAVPCYAAAPYRPQASIVVPQVVRAPNGQNVIPVTIGEAVPVFASLPPLSGRKEELPSMQKEP